MKFSDKLNITDMLNMNRLPGVKDLIDTNQKISWSDVFSNTTMTDLLRSAKSQLEEWGGG